MAEPNGQSWKLLNWGTCKSSKVWQKLYSKQCEIMDYRPKLCDEIQM